jgi:hypothetical protein
VPPDLAYEYRLDGARVGAPPGWEWTPHALPGAGGCAVTWEAWPPVRHGLAAGRRGRRRLRRVAALLPGSWTARLLARLDAAPADKAEALTDAQVIEQRNYGADQVARALRQVAERGRPAGLVFGGEEQEAAAKAVEALRAALEGLP